MKLPAFLRPTLLGLGAGAGLVSVLAGCRSAPISFLTLDPVAPGSLSASIYAGPPVRIDSVVIPAELDRPELVREFAANQLQVDDSAHWSAPLGQLVRTTLTRDMLARLPAGEVVFPGAPAPAPSLDIAVEVLAVSEGSGQLSIDVGWTAIARAALSRAIQTATPPVAPVGRQLHLSAPLAGSSASAHAAALSALVAQLADAMAAQLGAPVS